MYNIGLYRDKGKENGTDIIFPRSVQTTSNIRLKSYTPLGIADYGTWPVFKLPQCTRAWPFFAARNSGPGLLQEWEQSSLTHAGIMYIMGCCYGT